MHGKGLASFNRFSLHALKAVTKVCVALVEETYHSHSWFFYCFSL